MRNCKCLNPIRYPKGTDKNPDPGLKVAKFDGFLVTNGTQVTGAKFLSRNLRFGESIQNAIEIQVLDGVQGQIPGPFLTQAAHFGVLISLHSRP